MQTERHTLHQFFAQMLTGEQRVKQRKRIGGKRTAWK